MPDHNFTEIPKSKRMRIDPKTKVLVDVKRWHCANCDSIVEFPADYTYGEVNARVALTTFKCLPPMELQDKADTDYFEKKYGGKEKALRN